MSVTRTDMESVSSTAPPFWSEPYFTPFELNRPNSGMDRPVFPDDVLRPERFPHRYGYALICMRHIVPDSGAHLFWNMWFK